jgi:ATP-dependent Clp endopeptidase proteolytic subunit ClpP
MNYPNEYERQLFEKGIIYFTGEVTQESMRILSEKLLSLNEDKNFTGVVTLYINSPGGDMCACFGTIEVLKRLRLRVVTIGIGEICSCGLLLFMAGRYRILTKNTAILSHAYYWGKEGKHHELKAARKEQDLAYNRLIMYYKEQTGLPEEIIKKKLLPEIDIWLTPKEAIKYKLAHKII